MTPIRRIGPRFLIRVWIARVTASHAAIFAKSAVQENFPAPTTFLSNSSSPGSSPLSGDSPQLSMAIL